MVSWGDVFYHRLAEGMKHVFAIRYNLGDPDYVNVTLPLHALLNDDYMASLKDMTHDESILQLDQYGGKYNLLYKPLVDAGTTHLSVLDGNGLAVALTSTINTYFGSKVISPSTGILWNNEMDDFSIPGAANYFGLASSPYNYPAPGKKPLSSMSPSIVLDSHGKVRLVGGASGGPRIITSTAQVILQYLGQGQDLLAAVVHPRLHDQLLPQSLEVEDHELFPGLPWIIMPSSVVEQLIQRGQRNITMKNDPMGVAQFIAVDPDTGLRTAVSDPRKGGRPAAV